MANSNPTPRLRQETWIVGALTAAGLLLRLALWRTQSIPSVDGISYIGIAAGLSRGSILETVHQYGYPALVVVFELLTGDWFRAAKAVDLVFGTLLIPLTWMLARAFVSRAWYCLLPAGAVAFMPLSVRYSLTTMSEAPYLAFLVAAFILAARRRPLLAGVSGGLAYAIRPEALIAVGILVLFGYRRPREAGRVALGLVMVVAAYVTVVGVTSGKWTLSQKTANVVAPNWWDYEPEVGGEAVPEGLSGRASRFGPQALRDYPRRWVELGSHVLGEGGWVPPLLALAALPGPGLPLTAGLAQFFVMPLASTGTRVRFALPYLPFLWILSAIALDRLGSARARRWLLAACLLGLSAGAVVHRDEYVSNEDGYFPELVAAGTWLKRYVGESTVVCDRKPYVAFYAGARMRTIPQGKYGQILGEIVESRGDYLVVNEFVTPRFRGQLTALVDDLGTIQNESRLVPIYCDDSRPGRRTLIYWVNWEGRRDGPPAPIPPGLERIPHGDNHLAHAVLALRGGNLPRAAAEYRSVLAGDPDNVQALAMRARLLSDLGGDLEEAETLARRAAALEPGDSEVVEALVGILRRRGKLAEAEAVLHGAR